MTIYRGPAPEAVLAVRLDQLTAVHHLPAGATHLLAEPAPEILAALREGPGDLETLCARLADRFELGDDAGVGIAAHLDDLIASGLVSTA